METSISNDWLPVYKALANPLLDFRLFNCWRERPKAFPRWLLSWASVKRLLLNTLIS